MATLQKAAKGFDIKQGNNFAVYAKVCLCNAFWKYKREQLICSDADKATIFYEEKNEGKENRDAELLKIRDILSLRSKLSCEEYSFLYRYYIENEKLEKLGEEAGVSYRAAWGRLQRVLAKVKP